MKMRTVLTIGFFGGAVIGGSATFLSLAPAVTTILMKPLKWLAENISPYPSESPANLLIAFPLMLIYWGCLGAFVGLLLRTAVRLFVKLGGRDKGKP